MKNATKIEKNGQIFRITDEVAQKKLGELESLIDPLQITRGGTGSKTAVGANENLGFYGLNMAGNSTTSITMSGNLGIIMAKRSTTYYVALVTYWDNTPSVISSNGTVPTITKSANSSSVTITNNSSSAIAVAVIAIPNKSV